MAEVIILMGLPGAGKTTFFLERFAATHEHVSKDRLRSEGRSPALQSALIAAALGRGRSVVVDNTNATLPDRAAIIALARAARAEVVGYYFEPDLPGSRRRNAGRQGRARVPVVAIHTIARKLCVPRHEEGFDRLHGVQVALAGGFLVSAPWATPPG